MKRLLKKTEQDFVAWFSRQDDTLKYDLMTTAFEANTELGRFRRLYLKLLNHRNLRSLKS